MPEEGASDAQPRGGEENEDKRGEKKRRFQKLITE